MYSFSVASLKSAIERKTKIPAASLVLLVSGGEVLLSDHMVSSYSAGTDTNPIYMFSKPSVKESHLKQSSKYLYHIPIVASTLKNCSNFFTLAQFIAKM